MSVSIENLSMPDFLMLLRYEGHPPPDPEFDSIRMTPEEWAAAFPGLVQGEQGEESDVGVEPAAEVPATDPAPAAN